MASKLLQALQSATGSEDAAIPLATWKSHCTAHGLLGPAKSSARALFNKYKRKLFAANLIICSKTTVKLVSRDS